MFYCFFSGCIIVSGILSIVLFFGVLLIACPLWTRVMSSEYRLITGIGRVVALCYILFAYPNWLTLVIFVVLAMFCIVEHNELPAMPRRIVNPVPVRRG